MPTSAANVPRRTAGSASRREGGRSRGARISVKKSRRLTSFIDMSSASAYSTAPRDGILCRVACLLPYPKGARNRPRSPQRGCPMRRRAVITGLGIVSPIGVGVERFWASARAGRSGIGTPTLFDASKLPRECQIVGEVTDFDVKEWLPGAAGRMAGRFSQFAVAAAKMARDDAKLDSAQIPPEQVKVSIGPSI